MAASEKSEGVLKIEKVLLRPVSKNRSVVIGLFTNVANCSELKNLAIEGTISVALISCKPILDVFQILAAVHRAVHNQEHGKMTTRNIHTEVLYSLSASKNISDAFKKFGICNSDRCILMVRISSPRELEAEFLRAAAYVKGDLMDIGQLADLVDESAVMKVYKIRDGELLCGTMLDAVVSRIACKEIVSI